MGKKYIVELSAEERGQIREIISKGKHSARKIQRAQALLKSDEGCSDSQISNALNISIPTLERVRRLWVEEGLHPALNGRESKRVYSRKLDGEKEAHLIALICSKAPEGHARWTMRLLADRMVQLEYIEEISHETIRRTLKKTNLSLG